jgi:hypothetical protein
MSEYSDRLTDAIVKRNARENTMIRQVWDDDAGKIWLGGMIAFPEAQEDRAETISIERQRSRETKLDERMAK